MHVGHGSFSTSFSVAVATHVTARDSTTDFQDNAALVVQIGIICKDKHSFSQRDVCEWIEGSYAITFYGFV